MSGPTCRNCGGPIGPRNVTGYCIHTADCRSMANAVRRRDATKTDRRRAGKLLTEVRDLDTNEIIIDDIAISIAVRGNRLVSLTQTERRIVTKRLLSRGYEDKEIAAHLGVRVQTAVQIIQGVRDVKEAQHDS